MRHMKHMVGCVLLIGLLVGARIVGVVSSTAGLVLVVCPILMIGMFLMMNRDHGESAEGAASDDGAAPKPRAHR